MRIAHQRLYLPRESGLMNHRTGMWISFKTWKSVMKSSARASQPTPNLLLNDMWWTLNVCSRSVHAFRCNYSRSQLSAANCEFRPCLQHQTPPIFVQLNFRCFGFRIYANSSKRACVAHWAWMNKAARKAKRSYAFRDPKNVSFQHKVHCQHLNALYFFLNTNKTIIYSILSVLRKEKKRVFLEHRWNVSYSETEKYSLLFFHHPKISDYVDLKRVMNFWRFVKVELPIIWRVPFMYSD